MSTPPGARIDRWARIMASAWRHEKFLGLDADPIALWGMALSWSMDHGTDGRIPDAAIRQILPALRAGRATKATAALVERRLWEHVTGGFQIHDWTYYNPTVEDLDSLRAVRAEVGKRGASARWASDGKSHSGNDGKSHSKSHSKSHGKPMAEVEVEGEIEIEKEIEKEHPQTPGAPAPRVAASDGFEEFWKAYPRKQDRAGALRAWNRLNPPPLLRFAMLKALDTQRRSKAWTKDSGEFIPHASTWINRRRWEDEPPAPGAQSITDKWDGGPSGEVVL